MKTFLCLITVLGYGFSTYAQQPAKRPNIVIIVSDDHAYQAISAYGGNLMQTPSIDRIAREGAIMNKAYVTNSICGPSRAVILTGKYSHKNGFKDNENSSFDGSQNTFVKELGHNGYQTAWVGKWHLETEPQGFDYWKILPGQGHYFNPDFINMDGSRERIEGYVSSLTQDVAEEWLDSRDKTKPFALVIGHKATHRTWMPDLNDMGIFDGKTFPLPANFYDHYKNREAATVQDMTIDKTMIMGYDLKMFPDYDKISDGNITRMTEAQRARFKAYYKPIYEDLMAQNLQGKALVEWKFQRYMRDYLATAASMDRSIGRMLDYLDQHGLAENTLVLYLSDQGFYMGEHGWFDKRFMYEESFRTPMVVRWPAVVKPGSQLGQFVMNLDIAPTMLHAAGVRIPNEMQGESFLKYLQQPRAKGREAMYYHYYENGEHAVSPHFGIRTERYKLIRFYKRVESWELYDLEKDPQEMNNLYGQKGYEKITAKLRSQLREMIKKYEDDEARQLLEKGSGNS
ncbi:sulfatase family protein [Pontibacter ramchanderi]|uniref:Arylsulfatase A-like enzyme n=1 Tax=Pontibacter ramchanderi TaxID=1179743 RepID=A0A2N3U865_9BACT|nr:sulfatase [Pontibacter ramchanderi]PKV62942.1 arylsulfatase A-like enzyme [Pontibacter ramchanderi]